MKPAARSALNPVWYSDQLNEFLKPSGLFFPANVSTSSRATIGGMVATDASGKGSRIYGKTSAYIEQLEIVLADGSDYCVRPTPIDKLSKSGGQSAGRPTAVRGLQRGDSTSKRD